jgi:hypothetical protein
VTTKRWVVTIELDLKEDSHPRKWIPDTIYDVLDYESGEDAIDYKYVCLD